MKCRNADLEAWVLRALWRRANERRQRRLKRWAERWLLRNAPVAVPLAGPARARIVLDAGFVARHVLLSGGYELPWQAALEALLRSGMTFFDVGANIGVYTLPAAGLVGESGQVHAFEPAPAMFEHLGASVALSRFRNVTLNAAAAGDQAGTVTLHLAEDPRHSGWHSLAPSEKRQRRVEVPCVTLDGYVRDRGIRRVDFLKVDVEGGELLVLRGARELLSGEGAPMVQAELADDHCRHFGYTAADVKTRMAEHGYGAYQVGPDGQWAAVDGVESHPGWDNVLFLKPEHLPRTPPAWGLARAARTAVGVAP